MKVAMVLVLHSGTEIPTGLECCSEVNSYKVLHCIYSITFQICANFMAAAVKEKQKSSGHVVYPVFWRLSLLPSLSFSLRYPSWDVVCDKHMDEGICLGWPALPGGTAAGL